MGNIERDPDGLIPDWNNTNLQIGLALPDEWYITAFINNLTDERRVTTREDNRTEAAWMGATTHQLWEYQVRPRHYGMSVRKRFR